MVLSKNRLLSLCLVLYLFGSLTEVAKVYSETNETKRPNVILIIADDLGYAELGCYGQKWIKTPHLDQMAEEGIRFTQFYSGNAVCAPSRCCLMTAKHPGHAYIRNNGKPEHLQVMKDEMEWEYPGQNPIPDSEITLAELLHDQGYVTAAAGKWGLGHFGTSGDPNKQGFDLFYGFNCQVHAHNHYPKFLWKNHQKEPLPGNDRTLYGETYSQDRFTEVALDFIRKNRQQPFFLYLPFAIPHLAIQAPEESLDQYKGKIPEQEYQHRGYIKHPTPRAGYAAMISHMDRDIGKVLDLIKELNLDDNTLVLFSSDNGPTYNRLGGSDSEFFQSAGPFRGFKGSLYEGGIRVPLIARWPGKISEGQVSDHQAAFWDFLPTICEATRVKTPTDIDGVSFLPTLLGEATLQKQHQYLYWEFPAYGGQQAIRQGDWKAVRQNLLKKRNHPVVETELYYLADDPAESHNLAEWQPEILSKLEKLMSQAHQPSELFPMKPIDP